MNRLSTLLAAVLAAFLLVESANAQVMTTVTNGTIATTNTFQNALPSANGGRYGCTIQNQGTHTMYVFAGAAGNATLAKSLQLSPNQTFNCGMYGANWPSASVIQDAIQITGTSGDAYVVNAQ